MPDFSSLENDQSQSIGSATLPQNERHQLKITQLKKGSIAYSEYKEYCHLIQKLCETSELFLNVN